MPQAILIGLLTGEERVHISFVLAAFLANFPQSLSSASLLMEYNASPIKVLASWAFIWIVAGAWQCAALTCLAHALPATNCWAHRMLPVTMTLHCRCCGIWSRPCDPAEHRRLRSRCRVQAISSGGCERSHGRRHDRIHLRHYVARRVRKIGARLRFGCAPLY